MAVQRELDVQNEKPMRKEITIEATADSKDSDEVPC